MRNTHLVRVLMDGGVNETRAEAFERALDDHPYCGISAARLEAILVRHEAKNVERFNALMEQYIDLSQNTATRNVGQSLLESFRH